MESIEILKARQVANRFPTGQLETDPEHDTATISWVSKNPAVSEPLTLKFGPRIEPSLYWYRGYMYDFPEFLTGPGHDQIAAICEFLGQFFLEEIGCGIRLRDGHVAGGGPVWFEEDEPYAWWNEAGVVVRSWHGSRDRDQLS